MSDVEDARFAVLRESLKDARAELAAVRKLVVVSLFLLAIVLLKLFIW